MNISAGVRGIASDMPGTFLAFLNQVLAVLQIVVTWVAFWAPPSIRQQPPVPANRRSSLQNMPLRCGP